MEWKFKEGDKVIVTPFSRLPQGRTRDGYSCAGIGRGTIKRYSSMEYVVVLRQTDFAGEPAYYLKEEGGCSIPCCWPYFMLEAYNDDSGDIESENGIVLHIRSG